MPIGVLAVLVVVFKLHLDTPAQRHRVDYLGAGLLTGGVSALVLLTPWGGNEYAWASLEVIGLGLAAIELIAAFVWQERRAPEPILPLALFRRQGLVPGGGGLGVVRAVGGHRRLGPRGRIAELVAILDVRDVVEVAGLEVVDADDAMAFVDQVVAQMRAEEPGAAGDEDLHDVCLSFGYADAMQRAIAQAFDDNQIRLPLLGRHIENRGGVSGGPDEVCRRVHWHC